MSWQYVQRAKMQRTPWGSLKLKIWDFWTVWMGFFDIQVGDMPASWRKGT